MVELVQDSPGLVQVALQEQGYKLSLISCVYESLA